MQGLKGINSPSNTWPSSSQKTISTATKPTNGNSTGLKTTEDKPAIIPKHPEIITTLTCKNKGSVKADNNCTVFSKPDNSSKLRQVVIISS